VVHVADHYISNETSFEVEVTASGLIQAAGLGTIAIMQNVVDTCGSPTPIFEGGTPSDFEDCDILSFNDGPWTTDVNHISGNTYRVTISSQTATFMSVTKRFLKRK
jgi:hypothetical protein